MAGSKTLFSTLVTDVKSTDVEGVGRIRWEGDLCYRWIKNNASADIAANSLVCHTLTGGSTSLQNGETPATADLSYLGGVAISTIKSTTGTNCYGWIQVLGMNSSVAVTPTNATATSTALAGASLLAVNAAVYATVGAAVGTAPIYRRTIILLDTVPGSTAAQTCNVYISCL